MRKFQIFSLAIFAVLALGATVASSAFAAPNLPQLLVGGKTIALGVEEHIEVLAESNKLVLEDMGVGTAVSCTPEGLGFALSNGEGSQTTGTCSAITVTKGTCGSPEVIAQNLPWTLQLTEPVAGTFESTLKSGGEGPGWLVACTVLGVRIDDICLTQNGLVLVLNEETGLVHIEFEQVNKIEWANCTVGGKEEGLVTGLFFLHLLGSGTEELETLAASSAEEVS